MTSVTKEYVDQQCMVGSGNAAWVPCVLAGGSNFDDFRAIDFIENRGANDLYLRLMLPLPTNKGGKKLYVSGVRVGLVDADDDDYLNMIKVIGLKYSTSDALYQNYGDWKSQQKVEYTFTGKNASGYDQVAVTLHIVATSYRDVKISGILLKCYYG